jgi:TonB family protein
MSESVTDIIVTRARKSEDLRTMILWSALAHAVAVAVIEFAPRPAVDETARTVMTISLGGAPGPRSGGMTQLGAKAVQAPAPEEPVRRAETPPAPVTPPMTLPDPKVARRPEARPRQAPDDARARKPNTGEEPREGNAPVETNVRRGQGFGLSSSGGAGGSVQLDVANFCCPEYLDQMVTLIQRNWNNKHGVGGITVVRFTILRDGTIQSAQVEKPSGFDVLDSAATRAVALTRLPMLPAAYDNPSLGVHMIFDYQR